MCYNEDSKETLTSKLDGPRYSERCSRRSERAALEQFTAHREDLPKERPQTLARPDTCGLKPRVLLAMARCPEASLEKCQSSASRILPRFSLAAAAQTREAPNKH